MGQLPSGCTLTTWCCLLRGARWDGMSRQVCVRVLWPGPEVAKQHFGEVAADLRDGTDPFSRVRRVRGRGAGVPPALLSAQTTACPFPKTSP